MSNNMDKEDRDFFSTVLHMIEKRLEKIEKHQEKTCDELSEVDKNVIKLQTDFENYKENNTKNEEKEYKRHVSKREWILVKIGMVGVVTGTIALVITAVSLLN